MINFEAVLHDHEYELRLCMFASLTARSIAYKGQIEKLSEFCGCSYPASILYRVIMVVVDLGWVDLDLGSFTTLLGSWR